MIRSKFGQARCQACHSWHFAINFDEKYNIVEFKCCRCQRLIKPDFLGRGSKNVPVEEKIE
jgi:NAD-dependent SIR2 family protein deacetylase